MQESDWDGFLQRLLIGTRDTVARFAAEHANDEVCYIAYDSEPAEGYVLVCFNTSAADRAYVRETHDQRVAYRRELLAKPSWRVAAYYQVKANAVLPFCNNTGDFDYQGAGDIAFPEWSDYAHADAYPAPQAGYDDYLESRVALMFAQAFDLLVDENAFGALRLASPTLLGFGFHDQEQVVVRMLNVPS